MDLCKSISTSENNTASSDIFIMLDFRAFNLTNEELEMRNRQKACLYFDEGYIFGKAGSGFERWNLACPTKYIHWALERLYQAYKEFAVK